MAAGRDVHLVIVEAVGEALSLVEHYAYVDTGKVRVCHRTYLIQRKDTFMHAHAVGTDPWVDLATKGQQPEQRQPALVAD